MVGRKGISCARRATGHNAAARDGCGKHLPIILSGLWFQTETRDFALDSILPHERYSSDARVTQFLSQRSGGTPRSHTLAAAFQRAAGLGGAPVSPASALRRNDAQQGGVSSGEVAGRSGLARSAV